MVEVSYLGLALVLLLLWPSVGFVRATWRENRRGALGVAVYTALALAFAVYQFFLR
ncbi:MAG: hypothetical protein ACM3XZ_12135 [Betaproteobacteria bacterium]